MTESELGMTYPEDHIQHITCAACRSLPMSRDYSRKIYYKWLNVYLVTHIGAQAYVQRGGAELEGAAIAGRFRLNRGSSEVETSDNSCLGEFKERSGVEDGESEAKHILSVLVNRRVQSIETGQRG